MQCNRTGDSRDEISSVWLFDLDPLLSRSLVRGGSCVGLIERTVMQFWVGVKSAYQTIKLAASRFLFVQLVQLFYLDAPHRCLSLVLFLFCEEVPCLFRTDEIILIHSEGTSHLGRSLIWILWIIHGCFLESFWPLWMTDLGHLRLSNVVSDLWDQIRALL